MRACVCVCICVHAIACSLSPSILALTHVHTTQHNTTPTWHSSSGAVSSSPSPPSSPSSALGATAPGTPKEKPPTLPTPPKPEVPVLPRAAKGLGLSAGGLLAVAAGSDIVLLLFTDLLACWDCCECLRFKFKSGRSGDDQGSRDGREKFRHRQNSHLAKSTPVGECKRGQVQGSTHSQNTQPIGTKLFCMQAGCKHARKTKHDSGTGHMNERQQQARCQHAVNKRTQHRSSVKSVSTSSVSQLCVCQSHMCWPATNVYHRDQFSHTKRTHSHSSTRT